MNAIHWRTLKPISRAAKETQAELVKEYGDKWEEKACRIKGPDQDRELAGNQG